MSDFAGFANLEDAYTNIISAWVGDLRQEFVALDDWWNELEKRLNVGAENVARYHWPAGLVSHPRIIALYRKYFFRVKSLNVERHEQMMSDEEPVWGRDDEEDDINRGPIPENVVLLDMMRDYAPDLAEHFRLFVFLPIGEDPDMNPC